MNYEKMEKNDQRLIVGQVRIASEIIPEPKEFLFGLVPSKKDIYRTWVSEHKEGFPFNVLREQGVEGLKEGEEKMAEILTSLLGDRIFTFRDTFKEEKQEIFQKLMQGELYEYHRIYADLFDRTQQAIQTLAKEKLEIPYEIRVAAEVTLNDRLLREVRALKNDFKATLEKRSIDQLVEKAKVYGVHLKNRESIQILNDMLKEKMKLFQKGRHSDLSGQENLIEDVITLLDGVEQWGFELSKDEIQDLMDELLEECVGTLEKCWWGDGLSKPFPPNLIVLAGKLGFNVEKFLKITGPTNSAS